MKLDTNHENYKKFMNNILVIDVESTCLQDKSEVIEIGMCDTNFTLNEFILIKPEFSTINDFCTKLTSLTDIYIQIYGQNYEEGYNQFNQISSNYNTWASYGEYDKRMLEKMSELYQIEIKLPNNHLNVRQLFAEKILKLKDSHSAPKNPKDALQMVGLEFQGFNHRGVDDAKNIATLLNLILNQTK
jgi:inhibitor of KinA sporulation pathway (predicted exonuclease)